MLACLLVIERNVRKLGKAGMQNLTFVARRIRRRVLRLGVPRRRERWHRDDTP